MKAYTVVGIWPGNLRRYSVSVTANTPEEAEQAAVDAAGEGSGKNGCGLYVCGVFEGRHEHLDAYENLAFKMPREDKNGDGKIPDTRAFTVVGATKKGAVFVKHVSTSTAKRAELACVTPVRLVAAVLPGHLDDAIFRMDVPKMLVTEEDIRAARGE